MYEPKYDNEPRLALFGEIERLSNLNYELKCLNEQLLSENQSLRRRTADEHIVEDLRRTILQLETELKERDAELNTYLKEYSPMKRTGGGTKVNFTDDDVMIKKNREIEALHKENQSLKSMKELYNDAIQQNQAFQRDLEIKEKEINILREQLETAQSESDRILNFANGHDYRWKAPSDNTNHLELYQENAFLKEKINGLILQISQLQTASDNYRETMVVMQKEEERKIQAINDHWELRFREVLQRELQEQAKQLGGHYPANIRDLEKRIDEYEYKHILLRTEIERLSQENNQKARILSENATQLQSQEEKLFVLLEENYKLGAILEKNEQELAELRSFENVVYQNKRQGRTKSPPNSRLFNGRAQSVIGVADIDVSRMTIGYEDENTNLVDNLARKIQSQNMTIADLESKIQFLETGGN